MKRLLFPIAAFVAAGVFTSCKTTEKNYRAAYEVAAAHAREKTGLDSTIYAKIRNDARRNDLIVGTDTLPMQTEYIGYTENGGADRANIQTYNVVVGKFKQIFNAREMRKRLLDQGYEAMIVHTREPLYYVLTATCSTAAEALEQYKRVLADTSLVLRPPLPFILRPAHLAR